MTIGAARRPDRDGQLASVGRESDITQDGGRQRKRVDLAACIAPEQSRLLVCPGTEHEGAVLGDRERRDAAVRLHVGDDRDWRSRNNVTFRVETNGEDTAGWRGEEEVPGRHVLRFG